MLNIQKINAMTIKISPSLIFVVLNSDNPTPNSNVSNIKNDMPIIISPLYICPSPGIKNDMTAAIPGFFTTTILFLIPQCGHTSAFLYMSLPQLLHVIFFDPSIESDGLLEISSLIASILLPQFQQNWLSSLNSLPQFLQNVFIPPLLYPYHYHKF